MSSGKWRMASAQRSAKCKWRVRTGQWEVQVPGASAQGPVGSSEWQMGLARAKFIANYQLQTETAFFAAGFMCIRKRVFLQEHEISICCHPAYRCADLL